MHGDDLGLSRSFNEGIRRAHAEGFLTSTCIRANGTAFEEAVHEILPQCPDLGFGVHLNLVEGRSERKDFRGSKLCDPDGTYRFGFLGLLLRSWDKRFLTEIEDDYRDQIDKIRGAVAQPIDHLNSHQHSHGIPAIFEIVCKLAREYDIPYVRLPAETAYYAAPLSRHLRGAYLANLIKAAVLKLFLRANRRIAERMQVRFADRFVGILYTGMMDRETIRRGVAMPSHDEECVEVLLHPCVLVGTEDESFLPRVRDYVIHQDRRRELESVSDLSVGDELRSRGWTLTHYRALCDPAATSVVSTTPVAARRDNGEDEETRKPVLRLFAILDETPFYHPAYLRKLLRDCEHCEVVGAARVVLPRGGVLQRYLLENWRLLGVRELTLLGLKSWALRLFGRLPRFLRGDFDGSIAAVLRAHGIPFRTVSQVNDDEFVEHVKSLDVDVVLSSNSLIFKEALLRAPRLACINRHSALLPSMGGLLPAFRALQMGERSFGVTVHKMTPVIDQGEILSRKWFPIEPGDTLDSLYRHAFTLSYEATSEALGKLRFGDLAEVDDAGLTPSYHRFPEPHDWRQFRANGGRFI